jgi:hypothetical protein
MFTISRPRLIVRCSESDNKKKNPFIMKGFLTKIFAPDGEVDYEHFNKNSKYAIRIKEKEKKDDK